MWECLPAQAIRGCIQEHPAQVGCCYGFWHLLGKAQVMGKFGNNSVPVPKSVTCMSGVGVGAKGGGLRAKLVSWWT